MALILQEAELKHHTHFKASLEKIVGSPIPSSEFESRAQISRIDVWQMLPLFVLFQLQIPVPQFSRGLVSIILQKYFDVIVVHYDDYCLFPKTAYFKISWHYSKC